MDNSEQLIKQAPNGDEDFAEILRTRTMDDEGSPGKCYLHLKREAELECVECGRGYCPDCVQSWEGEPFCLLCLRMMAHDLGTGQLAVDTVSTSQRGDVPWAMRDRLGNIKAFIDNIYLLVSRPTLFFSRLKFTGRSEWQSLWFAVASIIIFSLLFLPVRLFDLYLLKMFIGMMPESPIKPELIPTYGDHSIRVLLVSLMGFLNVYFIALVIYWGMKLHRPKTELKHILAIVGYTFAAEAFGFLPLIGRLVVWVVQMFWLTSGLTRIYELKKYQAFMVACLPFALSILLSLIGVALVGG